MGDNESSSHTAYWYLLVKCVGSFPTEVLVRRARATGGLGSERVWHPVSDCHIKRNPKRPGCESSAALRLAWAQLLCGWHHTLQTDRSGLTWVCSFGACMLNAFICWECGFYTLHTSRHQVWRYENKCNKYLNFSYLVERSFPTHCSLMGESPEAIEGQAKLFRVLIAFAKYSPQVGYSQGNGLNENSGDDSTVLVCRTCGVNNVPTFFICFFWRIPATWWWSGFSKCSGRRRLLLFHLHITSLHIIIIIILHHIV